MCLAIGFRKIPKPGEVWISRIGIWKDFTKVSRESADLYVTAVVADGSFSETQGRANPISPRDVFPRRFPVDKTKQFC